MTPLASALLASVAFAGDPLCDYKFCCWHHDGWDRSSAALALEVELEGPTIGTPQGYSRLARVITAYRGWVDSGWLWIEDLDGYPDMPAGVRLVVFGRPTSQATMAAQSDSPSGVWAIGPSQLEPWNPFGGPRLKYFRDARDQLRFRYLGVCTGDELRGFGCPTSANLDSPPPWYGETRERLRFSQTFPRPSRALEPAASIAGAPPPGGLAIHAELAAAGLLPSWESAQDLYADIVRVALTHAETVDPLGHDGCRAFGTVVSVSLGPRAEGDRIALRVPPPFCLFDQDVDRPITWIATLEPTDDPRSDAAVVDLWPLEPHVLYATLRGLDHQVYDQERPACSAAQRPD